VAHLVRDALRRADRAEAALRAAQRSVEAVQRALLSTGPLMRFLRLYSDLDQAAEPLAGRQVESASPPHPFDRPMPHLSTLEARHLQQMADRALHRMCDVIADFFNENRAPNRVCLACGGPVDRTGRPPSRRRAAMQFLRTNLAGGPIPEEIILQAARVGEISRSTLRRAADELGVGRVLEDGQWWWKLPEVF